MDESMEASEGIKTGNDAQAPDFELGSDMGAAEGNRTGTTDTKAPKSEFKRTDRNPKEAKVGLAFSCGGIRAASFCSGVLRRLLHRGVELDCISCASGGNYTAASYVHWKYHHGNKDDHAWHKDYFEQMRRNAGYICNWRVPWKGALETLLLICLLLIVNIVTPFVVWGSFSIPVAYVVDIAFGDAMRIGFNCKKVTRGSEIITACGGEFDKHHPEIQKPMTLFSLLILFFVVLSIAEGLVSVAHRFKVFILMLVSGSILAFALVPWLIQVFVDAVPWWLNIIVILMSVFFWLGFPLLRSKASLVMIFYTYGYLTRWRVYKGHMHVLGIDYTEDTFFYALLISGFLIWSTPFLGLLSNTAIFTFYKWRLQKSFFYDEDSGLCGCQGITYEDCFPVIGSLCQRRRAASHRPLTMHDIRDVKPEYVSNVAVDHWSEGLGRPTYGLLEISPNKVVRIDCQPGAFEPGDTLGPEHIKVAEAMTISAAAVTNKEVMDDAFTDLQILLGLAIRKNKKSYYTQAQDGGTLMNKVGPFLIQSFVALPLVFLATLYFLGWHSVQAEQICMLVFGVYVFLFAVIACWPETREWGKKFHQIVRWCHVHLYHVRFLRELLRISKRGADPPALLTLSDPGRLEKYGLIPLLKRRLPKIVVVDGSFLKDAESYTRNLLKSLKLARELIGCEFVGYDGREVLGEIERKYVQCYPAVGERHQRSYKFIVRYFQEDHDKPASSGEIVILAPRHPDDGVEFPVSLDTTWHQFTSDTRLELDEKLWGKGFVLKPREADRLTFCCCECCHSRSSCIRKASRVLCSVFPSHPTFNQFFTPSQFTAYHREGYRACVEAGVEEFLKSEIHDL